MTLSVSWLVAVAALLAATGTAQAQQMGEEAAIARAQRDSARLPWTTADVQFMQGMIHHHAQAIEMCKWAPTHGASDRVQTLCARIINAQGDEINLMSQWLRDRRQDVPAPTATAMKMVMNGKEMDMLMPGMLSADQMKQLDAARGPAWDKLFLQGMIQHHQGAVSMVHDLFETQGAGQDETIFKFASDVNVDQTTEIARMEKMLFALTIEGNGQ